MDPEGVSLHEMTRTKSNHGLSVVEIKEIMGTLWAARLLGWTPADTLSREYSQIADAVAQGSPRPADA
jgi:hypothetical protein